MNHLLIRPKKGVLFLASNHLLAGISERVLVYMCTYFLFKKNTHKQKVKQTKEEKIKSKETKGEKKKENVAVVNSVCGKSNGIQ